MTKKIFIIITVTVVLVIIGLIGYNFYKSKTIPNETGAMISQLSQTELDPYNQMYNLLDKGIIIQPSFEIKPLKQKRVFEIRLKLPSDKSKIEFYEWLKQNNYDKIPREKFLFII